LQDEVSDRLKSFLLTHDKADLFAFLVTKKFSISCASFLPLIISETIELASDAEDALLLFLTSDLSDFGKLSLLHLLLLGVSIVDVVRFFFRLFGNRLLFITHF
jgi:hypothetical protein